MNSTEDSDTRSFFSIRYLVLCLLLLAAAAYATCGSTLPRIGRWLDVGEEPQPCDYLLVLNGDRDTRPFAAADLYQRGMADTILILSTPEVERPTTPPEHEMVRSILLSCDVPDSKIQFLDRSSGTTFDEANALKGFLSEHPGVTCGVITNDYHTRRTRWVFRRVLGDQSASMQMLAAKTDDFGASNWWRHEEGFVYYLSEFFKFSFYVVRYGYGAIYLGLAAGLIGVIGWFGRRTTMERSLT